MFERRLRIFLAILFLGGLLLVARAAQVQIIDGDEWLAEANSNAERVTYLDAPRGDLLDVHNRVIARDVPTFEACVNYRAIPTNPNSKWLREEAVRRARKVSEWSGADADGRELLIAREAQGVINDLDQMWNLLASLSGQNRAELDAARDAIVRGVEEKQKRYWQREYQKALDEFNAAPPAPWYARWIAGQRVAPKPGDYQSKEIFDQFTFHALLPDISQDVYNQLKLAQDRFPQYRAAGNNLASVLDLRPSVRRDYPFADVAAQTVGRVRAVSKEDREADPNADDEIHRYGLVDRIGGEGLESLLESRLRGTRGERRTNRRGDSVSVHEAVKGQVVRTSLDIELCKAIQDAFKTVEFHNPKEDGEPIKEFLPMNGAAVVIDVKTGQVRALVSVPSYDLNQFDQLYDALAQDELNRPMTNRALMDAMEPGSTVKPIVGLAAVTQKLIRPTDTIECDGYAHINGKRVERPRCWTMSIFGISHHQTNSGLHPTGFLTLTDAIERSCNVYFITEGSKLGLDGLSYWMRQFGYGQPTRIGLLPEARGLVPNMARIDPGERASSAWYASIGQGPVLATPIQIANEIATIARDGIWLRPTLFTDQSPEPTTRPDGTVMPDRIDLNLDPEGLKAVKKGMIAVVNSPAGTGKEVHRDDVLVAAKTGTATAAQLSRIVRDDDGQPVRDAQGDLIRELVPYGSHAAPNKTLPWYRLSGYQDEDHKPKGSHSWVGGFVPAENPQLAFAVYVEYGGSGGIGAASVVQKLIEKCIELKYINVDPAGAVPIQATDHAEVIIGNEN